ncbi:mCG144577, partial [Mus musculus]
DLVRYKNVTCILFLHSELCFFLFMLLLLLLSLLESPKKCSKWKLYPAPLKKLSLPQRLLS